MPEPPPPNRSRSPVTWVLDRVGSLGFGITVLALLFIYSSIGSSGLPIGPGIREYPFLLRPDAWVSVREFADLSEFQWFHWWPFDVLIASLCLSLATVTVRRIPLNVINLGVWLIHSGIIILAFGSVWYFSTKVEGDAPVARRQIVAALPGGASVRFVATPGAAVRLGEGEDAYTLRVSSITPEWELLSGDDAGKRAYKVSVMVQSRTQMYIRELLAGYPQYTEDLVRSDDPNQPFARAKKTLGTPLVDENLTLGLEYAAQEHFYLMESAAIYLRDVGATEWVQRPIRKLPRFNDHIASYDEVWTSPLAELPGLSPLDVEVPSVDPHDPLADVSFRVTDHLRYATMQSRRLPGGEQLDPVAAIRLAGEDGKHQDFEMHAFDPEKNVLGQGVIEFRWAATPEAVESLRDVRPAVLRINIPETGFDETLPITVVAGDDEAAPFVPLGDSGYAYRVKGMQDGLLIGQRAVSVAIVEIRKGSDAYVRWVFDDPGLTRDLDAEGEGSEHMQDRTLDDAITIAYAPAQRGVLRLVAGPAEDQLQLLVPTPLGTLDTVPLTTGQAVEVRSGITLTVTSYAARSRSETRPFVVPRAQRDRDVGVQASMIRVHVPSSGESHWLPYHLYPFRGREEVLSRFPYNPTTVHLADGRHIEILFSRERRWLPAPVVLDDFELTTHIGGYAGNNTSVRNWSSVVRFGEADGAWSEALTISVNDPQECDGYWFFQSQWDPPAAPRGPNDPGSQGLNYTVLGVGNRQGVGVQLAGTCIAVIGMIYAFYVKPTIKRRRRQAVYAEVARSTARETAPKTRALAPVAVEMEETG